MKRGKIMRLCVNQAAMPRKWLRHANACGMQAASPRKSKWPGLAKKP